MFIWLPLDRIRESRLIEKIPVGQESMVPRDGEGFEIPFTRERPEDRPRGWPLPHG